MNSNLPDELGDNLVILDDNGALLYGHQLTEHIVKTGKTIPNVALVSGIKIEAYVSYILCTFPSILSVQKLSEYVEGKGIANDILKEISDSITLTKDDVTRISEVQRLLVAKGYIYEQ